MIKVYVHKEEPWIGIDGLAENVPACWHDWILYADVDGILLDEPGALFFTGAKKEWTEIGEL